MTRPCTYSTACTLGASPKRRAWLAKVCPCPECKAWRHPVRVLAPPPFIAAGWFAPVGTFARWGIERDGYELALATVRAAHWIAPDCYEVLGRARA